MFNVLLESPVPALALGALAATFAGVIYSATRSGKALATLGIVMLLTLAGVAAERLIETPREQVARTLEGLFAAIEADDLPKVLTYISPEAADVRSDAQTLMPQFQVETANLNPIEIEADNDGASVRAKPFVLAQHRKTGMRGGDYAELQIFLTCYDDRWLVTGYAGGDEWRRGAEQLRRGK